MSETSWVLSSIERDLHVERFKIDNDDVKGTPKGWSVRKRTLRGGRREGVDVIEIDNGSVVITVVPSTRTVSCVLPRPTLASMLSDQQLPSTSEINPSKPPWKILRVSN